MTVTLDEALARMRPDVSIDAEEREVKAALVVLALGAQRDYPDIKYLVLDDSDQGPWLILYGVINRDGNEVEIGHHDDWDVASNVYDNRTYIYEPYLTEEVPRRRRGPYNLDVAKVLADKELLLDLPREARIVRDTLVCPYEDCPGLDDIVEHDRGERFNEGSPVIEDGVLVHVAWRDSQRDFEHVDYRCSVCDREVTLPGNPTEEWT